MVCVDFAEGTQKLIAEVALLAKAFKSTVYVSTVATPNEDGDTGVGLDMSKQYPEESEALSALANRLCTEGVDAQPYLITGIPSPAINKEVEKLGVDLIVMGTHGKGLVVGTFIGSVSQGVVKHSKIPVHLVPVNDG